MLVKRLLKWCLTSMRKHYLLLFVLTGFLVSCLIVLDSSPVAWHDEALYSAFGCVAAYDTELPTFGENQLNSNTDLINISFLM